MRSSTGLLLSSSTDLSTMITLGMESSSLLLITLDLLVLLDLKLKLLRLECVLV